MRRNKSWKETNIEIGNKNRVTYRYKRPISDMLADVKNCKINSGAGRENRTLISSLENSHTNHCTIPAYF